VQLVQYIAYDIDKLQSQLIVLVTTSATAIDILIWIALKVII